jgi:hypothetical protein
MLDFDTILGGRLILRKIKLEHFFAHYRYIVSIIKIHYCQSVH